MKNLERLPLPPTYISYFIAIREAKRIPPGDRGTPRDHRQVLTQFYEAIERRYGRFENAVDQRDLETIRSSSAMQLIASSLRSCYDGETKRLRELKDSIAGVQGVRVLKYCPLCGITSVATHDHYMPASLFPEFAVHPLNLVPCCFMCNSTKGDDWLDEDGNRLYMHTYLRPDPGGSVSRRGVEDFSVGHRCGSCFLDCAALSVQQECMGHYRIPLRTTQAHQTIYGFCQRRSSRDPGRLQDLHHNWWSQRSAFLKTKGTGKGGRLWR